MHSKFLKIYAILLLFPFSAIFAENADTSAVYLPSTVTERLNLGFTAIGDPYLSPLKYNGLVLGIEHFSQKFVSARNPLLVSEYKFCLDAATASNISGTASMQRIGGKVAWGLLYAVFNNPRYQLLAGGNADTQLGMKYLARNVNNPVNVDFSANLNFSAIINYYFPLLRRTAVLQFRFDTPLVGAMFVPQQGVSYYEMFSLGNTANTVHFSAPHNRIGLDYSFTCDIPLSHSVFMIGINSNYLKYNANQSVYSLNSSTLIIGWKYSFYVFKKEKERKMKNFMFVN